MFVSRYKSILSRNLGCKYWKLEQLGLFYYSEKVWLTHNFNPKMFVNSHRSILSRNLEVNFVMENHLGLLNNNETVQLTKIMWSKIKLGVVWGLVKGNKSHGTIIHQKMEPPKILISLLNNILFILFIKYSGVFSYGHFSQPTPFPILSCTLSLTPFICSSLPHSCLLPTLFFPASIFYLKWNWFKLPASLNKHISTNVVHHLGFTHNIS